MVLTDKQRNDLHQAILEYLQADPSFQEAATIFQKQSGVETKTTTGVPLLEKKWTSVVRLQRKVLELESKLKHVEAERKQFGSLPNGSGSEFKSGDTFLLKATSRHRFSGHRAPITSVAFHPRFNVLVTTSEDATIKLWDFETGEFERTLKGHTNVVQSGVFNEDGTLLATCSSDLSIKLWDFSSPSYDCIKTLMGHDHSVSGVAFLRGGGSIVSCSRDRTLKVWETNTGYCIRTLTGHDEWVRRVAVHNETNTVASCSNDHSIILWNLDDSSSNCLMATLNGHEHVVECVAFSSAVADRSIAGPAGKAGGKPSGGLHLASGSRDRTVKVWHVASATCLFTLSGHDNWVRAVAFEPHGKYLLTASEDKTIKTWDLQQQRCTRSIAGAHSHFITSLAIHPTLAVVATGSVDKDAALWVAAPTSTK